MPRRRASRKAKDDGLALMPVMVPVHLGAGPRVCIEASIEHLLAMLDRIDGDPDLEETGDDEPSLNLHAPGYALDAELDTVDDEPSLGSLDRAIDQRRWADGNHDADGELELSGGGARPTDDDPVFPWSSGFGAEGIDRVRADLREILSRKAGGTLVPISVGSNLRTLRR